MQNSIFVRSLTTFALLVALLITGQLAAQVVVAEYASVNTTNNRTGVDPSLFGDPNELVVSSTVAFAQTPVDMARLIFTQCQSAMGDVNSRFSIRASGTITDDGHQETLSKPFHFRSSGRGRTLWEIGEGQETQVWTSNGLKGRRSVNGVRKNAPSMSDTVYRLPEFVPAFACSNDALVIHGRISYEGTETVNGRSADRLHVRMANTPMSHRDSKLRAALQSYDLFIDQQTHLIAAWRRVTFSPDALENQAVLEMRFEQYRPEGGVQMPHEIHRLVNGRPMDSLHVHDVAQAAYLTDEEVN